MKIVQSTAPYETQFREIVTNAIDRRQFAEVSAPSIADTEFSIGHGLGFIPLGFIVIKQDQAAIFYSGDTEWDINFIYLKCNTALVAARILIF